MQETQVFQEMMEEQVFWMMVDEMEEQYGERCVKCDVPTWETFGEQELFLASP